MRSQGQAVQHLLLQPFGGGVVTQAGSHRDGRFSYKSNLQGFLKISGYPEINSLELGRTRQS